MGDTPASALVCRHFFLLRNLNINIGSGEIHGKKTGKEKQKKPKG
jgi:hypothetical protein